MYMGFFLAITIILQKGIKGEPIMKKRMFASITSGQCPYKCIYCFVNANSYKQGVNLKEALNIEKITNEIDIIQPACDSELLLERTWFKLLNKLAEFNKSISFATKKEITQEDVDKLKKINNILVQKGHILNIGVTICRYKNYNLIEPFAPDPEKRIKGLKRLYKAGIGCNVIIRPIFPDSDILDLYEIVNKTAAFCHGYLLGPLYVNDAVKQYIKCNNSKSYGSFQIKKTRPEWNQGEEMEVIYSPKLEEELKRYIIAKGCSVYDNNEDCVKKIREKVLGGKV